MPEQSSEKPDSLLMPSERAAQPPRSFQMPPPSGRAEGDLPLPSETLSDQSRHASATPPDLSRIDIQAVADRVYELMKAEVAQARRRGELSRRG